jgi:hypothetical protein
MPYLINDEQPGGSKPVRDQPAPLSNAMTVNGVTAQQAAQQRQYAAAGDTAVARAYNTFINAREQQRQYYDSLDRNRDLYSQDGIRAAVAALADSDVARSVDVAQREVHQRTEELEAEERQIRANLCPPGNTDEELRRGRAVARAERILGAKTGTGGVAAAAQQLIANADPSEIGVLAQELPSMLASRGVPADWLPGEVTKRVPALGAIQDRLAIARKAKIEVDYNANLLRSSLREGTVPTTIVDCRKYDPDR